MRILLTGSSGWLGKHLAPMLRAQSHSVIGVDLEPSPETTVVGSIVDRGLVDAVFAKHRPQAVVHSATLHKPDIARHPQQSFVDVNITGTLNLLEAAVAAGHDRFVFTSTTSLMISRAIRREEGDRASWLDRDTAPLEPRNIYGVTKLAAEGLCRIQHHQHGLACVVLRTGRFFPEEDDMAAELPTSGENTKAVEFLHRRLTADDAARAHVSALDRAVEVGFGVYVISAPTPFDRRDVQELKRDARSVITRYYPDAEALFARRGWQLPQSIGRVYDASHAERELGFRCETDFGSVLEALRDGGAMPFVHDPEWFTGVPEGGL